MVQDRRERSDSWSVVVMVWVVSRRSLSDSKRIARVWADARRPGLGCEHDDPLSAVAGFAVRQAALEFWPAELERSGQRGRLAQQH
ncbi:hypothetical protein GCM10010439_22840 [Actinocorallia aurantiaca]|uniref:Uncharacterized protein n=1 Tax=Actinocorallia aurantiaca TaxID=46204 RepID=A0ABP6GJ42_9ACTN